MSSIGKPAIQRLHVIECDRACDGFNTSYTGRDTAFGNNFEKADVTRPRHVRTTAKFLGRTDFQHPHLIAIFFAKQHHCAGFLCRFKIHYTRLGRRIIENFCIDNIFHAGNFVRGHRCIVRKVKTCFVGIDQRTLLLHMGAQYIAQRFMHQVRHRMMTHGTIADIPVDFCRDRVTDGQLAGGQGAVMAKNVGLNLLRILHPKQGKAGAALGQLARVSRLSA